MLLIPLRPSEFLGFHFWGWGWGWGLGASGFLPPTEGANEKSEDAKRFKRRSKVKESEHFLDVVVLLLRLLLGVGMILLSLLRLLLFLLVGAAVTLLEKIERNSGCFRSLSKLGCRIPKPFEAGCIQNNALFSNAASKGLQDHSIFRSLLKVVAKKK